MATEFRLATFTCPICGKSFETETVKSVSHRGQDADFFPHYIGKNPLPYFLVQCPNCLFCAYAEDYELPNATKFVIKKSVIKKILNQPIAKKLPETAKRFFLAGKIYEEAKRNPYYIGNIYLRGSWCCRILENRKSEIEMQQLAVTFLRRAVEKSTIVNPDNLPIVTYIIGELYRRLEDKKSAREWFAAVAEVLIDPDQQWVLEIAQKQAELNEHFIN